MPAWRASLIQLLTAALLIPVLAGTPLFALLESADEHPHEHRQHDNVLAVDSKDHWHETAHLEAALPCIHHECVACAKHLTSQSTLQELLNTARLITADSVAATLLGRVHSSAFVKGAPRGPPVFS